MSYSSVVTPTSALHPESTVNVPVHGAAKTSPVVAGCFLSCGLVLVSTEQVVDAECSESRLRAHVVVVVE